MLSSPNSSTMQELLDQPFFLNLQVNNHKQHFIENGKIGFQKNLMTNILAKSVSREM